MRQQFPWPLAWFGRGLLVLAAVAMAGWLLVGFAIRVATDDTGDCSTHVEACLDPKTGILRRQLIEGPDGSARPAIPCRFVGVWYSRRDQALYRIALNGDGSYVMGPSLERAGSALAQGGHWAVQGRHMIWRHGRSRTGPDTNPIEEQGPRRFVLVEMDGSRTTFELAQPADPLGCTP